MKCYLCVIKFKHKNCFDNYLHDYTDLYEGVITSIYFYNLTKVRPLVTLSHRGSDNSPLLIVFKWTLYDLCLCIYCIMISTNQIAYFKRSAVVLKMTKSCSLLSAALFHDFDQSDSVLLTQCSSFEDDEIV